METGPCVKPAILHFLFSIFLLSSCGAPGDPRPPQPVIPVAVSDLSAQQSGSRVVLTFTLPQASTAGKPLEEFPDLEIYRESKPATAKPSVPEQLIYTVPSALVETFLADPDATGPQRVRFEDPLRPESLTAQATNQWVYAVRTRARPGGRRSSAPSNVVALRVLPVPSPVGRVQATVTEAGVELQWAAAPPSATAPVVGYRVYRADVPAGTPAATEPSKAVPRLVGLASGSPWIDPEVEFGRSYVYTVRSVAQHGAESVESADSEPVTVTPRDTFAPAVPAGLVAVPVPATQDSPGAIELSWGIGSEADLAGYHVYRSDGTREERITRDLLLTPSFRDTSVAPGRRYTYRVTATDRAGNESARSEPVTESLPSP